MATVQPVPSPPLPPPRDRDAPHPSLRERTQRESRQGRGQIMFFVSDTEPEGGAPEAGVWAAGTPHS